MHVMVQLETRWSAEEVVQRAAAAGVGLLNAAMYYLRRPGKNEFLLSFAPANERKIQEGIRRLGDVLK